jgi:hypothetical protein
MKYIPDAFPIKTLCLFTVFLLYALSGTCQVKKDSVFSSARISDIPHKTAYEKWMWPHRGVAMMITKERVPTYDTSYIISYRKKLIITLPVYARLMQFNLIDWKTDNNLLYSPNFRYDAGIGLSTRWATFILNPGLVFFHKKNHERGVTKHFDLQLNLYGKRIVSDIVLQNYKGFYISNSQSYSATETVSPEVRPDVRALSLSTSTYYVFNYKKFSYRSSFAFTERQLKSCGSFLAGAYYTLFGVSADSSLVSQRFSPYFDQQSQIREGAFQTFGINLGYIYTLKLSKKVYTTISLVPGAGLNQTTYDRTDSTSYRSPYNACGRLNTRLALGRDNGKLYFGAMAIYDYFLFPSKKDVTFNYNYGKFMVFVGYRFEFIKTEMNLLRRFDLIDYEGDPRHKK